MEHVSVYESWTISPFCLSSFLFFFVLPFLSSGFASLFLFLLFFFTFFVPGYLNTHCGVTGGLETLQILLPPDTCC